ncbi:MAG: hypothetical protein ACLFUE_03715 [Desulfobacteraceae bacterium]
MIYYVYYDSYGYPRSAVSAEELRERYENDTQAFLRAVKQREQAGETGSAHVTAHVGTVRFQSDYELQEFLDGMKDANRGFFEAEGDSRPYNF